LGMYNAEKRRIVSGESWRQTYVPWTTEDLRVDLMDVENRAEWRRRTRVADPAPEGSKPA